MREDAEVKGRRYLTEGRLTVRLADAQRIVAIVKGGGEWYRVGYERGGWSCSCLRSVGARTWWRCS
jgi:hypothetical protein